MHSWQIDNILVFVKYVQQKYLFSNNTTVYLPYVNFTVYRFVSEWKRQASGTELDRRNFLVLYFCVADSS